MAVPIWDQAKSRFITERNLPPDGDDSIHAPYDGIVDDLLPGVTEPHDTPEELGPLGATWVREAEPHRDLFVRRGDYMRGADVRALQAATKRRLSARDIERPLKVDGVFGQRTKEATDTAAHFLGALESTTNQAKFPVGAQKMIRYPGTRTPEQLKRAEDRMDALIKDRARKPKPQPGGGGTGRTDANRIEARRIAIAAFRLAQQHAWKVHYTQGGSRWNGIRYGLKAFKGQYPTYADCSSMYTWAMWNAYDHFGWPDNINGLGWGGGYTGTMLSHGQHISANQLLPGDAVIYGRGFPGHHVSMYIGGGMCYSHGSEAGPFYIRYNYRSDIMGFRRYI